MPSACLLCSWSSVRAFAMYSPFTRRARSATGALLTPCAGAAARAVPRGTARWPLRASSRPSWRTKFGGGQSSARTTVLVIVFYTVVVRSPAGLAGLVRSFVISAFACPAHTALVNARHASGRASMKPSLQYGIVASWKSRCPRCPPLNFSVSEGSSSLGAAAAAARQHVDAYNVVS